MIRITIDCENVEHAQKTLGLLSPSAQDKRRTLVIEDPTPVAAEVKAAPSARGRRGGCKSNAQKAAEAAAAKPMPLPIHDHVVAPAVASPAAPANPVDVEAAQTLLTKVFETKGFETTLALLSRFGVARLGHLKATQIAEFTTKAQQTLDGTYDPLAGDKPAGV